MIKLGIIGAMELEVEELKGRMTVTNTTSAASMQFFEGTLNGISVVIVRCGIGKVNAGICVQLLADRFGVTHIINTGVAGSLKNEINIGDIVISTDAVQHDMDVTSLGYERGQIPGISVKAFPADEALSTLAHEACRKVNPAIGVFSGRVLSGDQFISSTETKDFLIDTYAGSCTEMEGAAIAQVCFLNDLPFVIIRAISDKADDSAHMDYPTFEREAAHHCAKLVYEMAGRLAG